MSQQIAPRIAQFCFRALTVHKPLTRATRLFPEDFWQFVQDSFYGSNSDLLCPHVMLASPEWILSSSDQLHVHRWRCRNVKSARLITCTSAVSRCQSNCRDCHHRRRRKLSDTNSILTWRCIRWSPPQQAKHVFDLIVPMRYRMSAITPSYYLWKEWQFYRATTPPLYWILTRDPWERLGTSSLCFCTWQRYLWNHYVLFVKRLLCVEHLWRHVQRLLLPSDNRAPNLWCTAYLINKIRISRIARDAMIAWPASTCSRWSGESVKIWLKIWLICGVPIGNLQIYQ